MIFKPKNRLVNFFASSPYRVPVVAIAALAVMLTVNAIAGRVHATALLSNIDMSEGVRPDVEVRLPFEPERFHLEAFQEVGRYLGWQDGRALILQADQDALAQLARNYWVIDISPHEGPS